MRVLKLRDSSCVDSTLISEFEEKGQSSHSKQDKLPSQVHFVCVYVYEIEPIIPYFTKVHTDGFVGYYLFIRLSVVIN